MSAEQSAGTPAAPSGARPAVPLVSVNGAKVPLVSVTGVAKAFGPTRALRSCSFELLPGEVHAIVGENGSGKSTLVKILSGVHVPDAGEIRLDGEPLSQRRSPRASQAAGVVTVFQEVLVVGPQSVLENVWLGTDGLFRQPISDGEKRRRAGEILERLLGYVPPLDVPVEWLSLSDRQACCIARALVRNPRVLILDESTSALDVVTSERLFKVVRELCAEGTGVIFISHRMDEIEQLADRVTVMRSGESIVTLSGEEAGTEALVRQMTGDEHGELVTSTTDGPVRTFGEILLRARGLRLRPGADPIEFELLAGELVGVAGLEGQGQDQFLEALRGAGSVAGELAVGDRVISSPQDAFAGGVAYIPRDRRSESLFPSLSVGENFGLPTMAQDGRFGLLNPRSAAARLAGYVKQMGIRVAHAGQPITVLSGGNQQKVIIARWLAAKPKVLLLNDPTRGIDLGAKRDLYRVLEQLTAEGVAVVMLSTEIDEQLELMDRVLVFREGGVVADIARGDLTRNGLVASFFGPGGREQNGT
jgi:ABC-type sugar transport system ATPase subunit